MLREKNARERMGMKCGMAQTRQNWIVSNHISREHKQLDFMQKLQSFQAHQTELMSEQDRNVAAVYEGKKKGNEKLVHDYTE